jgi:hypothetical protein
MFSEQNAELEKKIQNEMSVAYFTKEKLLFLLNFKLFFLYVNSTKTEDIEKKLKDAEQREEVN